MSKQKLIATIRAVPIHGRTYEEYVEAVADRLLAERYYDKEMLKEAIGKRDRAIKEDGRIRLIDTAPDAVGDIHGHWEEENRIRRSAKFLCSVCGGLAYYPQPTRDESWQKCCPYKYCPNCGAAMRDITDKNN